MLDDVQPSRLRICLSAGVVEEFAYRRLLFTPLAALVESWCVARLTTVVTFGVVHALHDAIAGTRRRREEAAAIAVS